MSHIMVDIESIDTELSAVVISIGAVVFKDDGSTGEESLGPRFYAEMTDDLDTQVAAGRTISPDTVKWWMAQTKEAQKVFKPTIHDNKDFRLSTIECLGEFGRFIGSNGAREVQLWGNGSDFDNAIIADLYKSMKMAKPWSFGKNRCFRTLKNLAPKRTEVLRAGVHHNALDDAISQALHAQNIFKWLKQSQS